MTSSGHGTFLPITFDRKEIETWERCQSVRFNQDASDMHHDLLRSLCDPDLKQPEVKFTN